MGLLDLRTRIDELINKANNVLGSNHKSFDSTLVDTEMFWEFRSASLSFLATVFGKEHSFYTEFDRHVSDISRYMSEHGRGILKAAKSEIDGGWLTRLKGLVSAEIFSDFLEMAEHLLNENYKDPAAVMVGSVLEEHLRQLAIDNSIELIVNKGDREIPKKADLINSDLASASVYNKLDQKSITAWLDLRNKAAHGKYGEYSKEQVDLMYQGVVNFISRTT